MSKISTSDIVWHHANITREDREKQNQHKSVVLWFTGLSGSGKSTLAHAVEEKLHLLNAHSFVLDGDNVRHGLCDDLTFSDTDRKENIRRIGNVAKLFLDAGTIVLTAFISPFKADRDLARSMTPAGNFIEIYCNTDIEICEKRDVKGYYQKARTGEIPNYTGISSPYEVPVNPELIVNTGTDSLEKCVDEVIELLESRKII